MDPLNREFVELLEASGWSAAEAARQLECSPGLISQYRTGTTRPSAQMVRLFKLVLATENPAALKPAGAGTQYPPHKNEFGVMNEKLIELKESDPRAFATVKTMIESVHAQATQPAPVKPAKRSKLDPIKQAELGGVAHLGAAVAMKSLGLTPKAASTTGKTSAPKPPAPRRKGAPPTPPAPAPSEP